MSAAGQVSIVVARSRGGVIGRDGQLPWRLPSDLRRFREITSGHTVVMGRRTFESLPPAFRPLPNRRNVVLSRDPAYRPGEGVAVSGSLEAALADSPGERFVIGGDEVYRHALPLAERLYITDVDVDVEGDAYFPALSEDEWRCIDESQPLSENGHVFRFRTYERQA